MIELAETPEAVATSGIDAVCAECRSIARCELVNASRGFAATVPVGWWAVQAHCEGIIGLVCSRACAEKLTEALA